MIRVRWWAVAWGCAAIIAAVAVAQPTFGPKKKPKPADAAPGDAKEPVMPGAANPGATPPGEWVKEDPERKEPSSDAKPGEYFCWKTADGLRYAWSLPSKYVRGEGYDIIVMLHPASMDFRWGPANHVRGEDGFRPDCVVVSVDGLGANAKRPELRSFECTSENCVRFRDVMLEFSRVFPVRRMYLYGQGSGGKFAAYFSGAFPALADGVLAHGCGITENGAVKSTVPIVFMHGAKDSITPLKVSWEAKKEYDEKGHKGVRVRVLREYNDFPNQLCAADCIDYLRGMRTEEPAEAVAIAKRMLEPKGQDEFGYRGVPWFAGAHAVLARLGDGPGKFEKDVPAEDKAKADALIGKIDAEAEANVANVRTLLKASEMEAGDFVLDGGPWLGYLLALRDDFRGVKSVEKLAADLNFDRTQGAHAEEAQTLWITWGTSAQDAKKFEDAVDLIPKCFLYEGLPVDLAPRTRACFRKADELEISAEARLKYEYIQLWDRGWREGMEAYELRWQKWVVE